MNTLQQESGEIKKEVTKDGEMGFFSKATAMFIINKYPQYSLQSFLSEISTYKNLRKEFFDCMDKQFATARAEGAAEERKRIVNALTNEPVRKARASGTYEEGWDGGFDDAIRVIEALTTKEHHAS